MNTQHSECGAGGTALTAERHERRFAVMGTQAHVLVDGTHGDQLLDAAIEQLVGLEQRWSRFLPTSEVSCLNRAGGREMIVGAETLELVSKAIFGWTLTQGRFDPSMLGRLIDLGYDRTFASVAATQRVCPPTAASPGCAAIDLDNGASTVRLAPGVMFDPGGIGKGLAADLVSARLIELGAERAIVNLGGDLRIRTSNADVNGHDLDDRCGSASAVAIREPSLKPDRITTVELRDGAVATSTTLRRRWSGPDGGRHHLLDPASGLPHEDGPVLTSVIAGEAWWAEVAATALMAPLGQPLAALSTVPALHVLHDQTEVRRNGFERYES